MTAAFRRFIDRFIDLFGLGALVVFTMLFLCIHILIWFYGSVRLFEPNRALLASEIGLLFIVVALGMSLFRRLRALDEIRRREVNVP